MAETTTERNVSPRPRAGPATKRYQHVLPMSDEDTVKNQFGGYLPLSVFRPKRRPEWDSIINDIGDPYETRRGENAKYLPGLRYSKFHPDLAEFVIRYWSLDGDTVVDSFAGRATRGIVSLELRRRYVGYEIAPATWRIVEPKLREAGGELFCADGTGMPATLPESADLVFTCPPYWNLEKYEDVPGQLSSLPTYEDFLFAMRRWAENVRLVLKSGRFCVVIVGDWRHDKRLVPFHIHIIDLLEAAGLILWDIFIIHNDSPFGPLQAPKVAASRYTSKVHEYGIVFRKDGAT